MSEWKNQTPWEIGPIEARRCERNGKVSFMGNVRAPVSLEDAVIKIFMDPESEGGPYFTIEARRDLKRNAG